MALPRPPLARFPTDPRLDAAFADVYAKLPAPDSATTTTAAPAATTAPAWDLNKLAGVLRTTGGVLVGSASPDHLVPAAAYASRLVSTNAPLTGGGDLTTDRTLGLDYTSNLRLTGGALDTAQDLQTTSTPEFAALGIGTGGAPEYPADVRHSLTQPTGVETALRAYQTGTFTANAGPTFRAVQALVELDPASYTLSNGANITQAVYALVQVTGPGTISGLSLNSAVLANLGGATVQSAYMYRAGAPTNSGGGTITTWVGFWVGNVTQAATVYGIQSTVNAAAGRWNLYISGTALNHMAGNLLLGTTTDGMTAGGSLAVAQDLAHRGTLLGFYNAAPAAKPTVSGSRGGNAALASLLTALAGLGLLTDSTT